MNAPLFCYYLVWRTDDASVIDWDEPTGGLVCEPERYVDNYPVCSMPLVKSVCKMRYHCAPGESLVIAEVFEPEDQYKADILHQHWEREMFHFKELMRNA